MYNIAPDPEWRSPFVLVVTVQSFESSTSTIGQLSLLISSHFSLLFNLDRLGRLPFESVSQLAREGWPVPPATAWDARSEVVHPLSSLPPTIAALVNLMFGHGCPWPPADLMHAGSITLSDALLPHMSYCVPAALRSMTSFFLVHLLTYW